MQDADDAQDLIRELLVRELETVNVYTELLESARTPDVHALLAEITAQEKHHIAEAADLLARYDAGQAAAFARAGVAVRREAPAPAPERAPVTVVYEPSGAAVGVAPDETLLAAGVGAGVDIRHDCGGKGVCGTCRVEVLEGGAAMSAVTAPERKHLADLLDAGWRLACQTRPGSAARLRVPPNERSAKKEDGE
jgi:ferredoxin